MFGLSVAALIGLAGASDEGVLAGKPLTLELAFQSVLHFERINIRDAKLTDEGGHVLSDSRPDIIGNFEVPILFEVIGRSYARQVLNAGFTTKLGRVIAFDLQKVASFQNELRSRGVSVVFDANPHPLWQCIRRSFFIAPEPIHAIEVEVGAKLPLGRVLAVGQLIFAGQPELS